VTTRRLRVLVYARYPAVRTGLRELLAAAGFEVAGELTANEAVEPLPDADVLVADLAGARDDAVVPADLAGALPVVHLVDNAAAVVLDADAPAAGWLPRDADGESLAAAVRAVAAGMLVLDPAFARPLDRLRVSGDGDAPPTTLTARELDVLRLVADGLPNKGIALALGISEHTVKFHLGAVLSKLDAHSRTEAVTVAARRGLLAL
jgi:DNA-binding NarL/FixJ family response regulator